MIKLYPWDPAEYLETEEDMAEYLEAALEQDDSWGVAYVLSDISRAKGMESAVESAWRDKKSIYKSEKRGDVLDFSAVMDAAQALGFRLYAGAAKTRRLPPSLNGNSQEGLISHLNAALDRCDALGAARVLRDIAEAQEMGHAVRDAWASDAPDFAAFMDAARALGLWIHAAVAHNDGRRRGRELVAKSSQRNGWDSDRGTPNGILRALVQKVAR